MKLKTVQGYHDRKVIIYKDCKMAVVQTLDEGGCGAHCFMSSKKLRAHANACLLVADELDAEKRKA